MVNSSRALKLLVFLFMLIGGLLDAVGFARAQSPECVVREGDGSVVVLVCPPSLDAEAWQVAGQRACDGKLLCNAWVWVDPVKAPEKAPKRNEDLTHVQVADAVAVWINDSQYLMLMRAVKK